MHWLTLYKQHLLEFFKLCFDTYIYISFHISGNKPIHKYLKMFDVSYTKFNHYCGTFNRLFYQKQQKFLVQSLAWTLRNLFIETTTVRETTKPIRQLPKHALG